MKAISKCYAKVTHNRLMIEFADEITKDQLESLYTDIRFCVADLRPGFNVISDFSQSSVLHLRAVPILRKIMNYLTSHQTGEIIRVMPTERLIHKQMLNLAMKYQSYRPVNVPSAEAAIAHLEKAVKRDGLRFYLHGCVVEYTLSGKPVTGNIVNISTSGCAVEPASPSLTPRQHLVLKFALASSASTTVNFTIQSEIVRVNETGFAVHFNHTSEESEEQLRHCLIYESQLEGK